MIEKYCCLQCFFVFERMYPMMVRCPKCQSKDVFWATSPFIAPYAKDYIPEQGVNALLSSGYIFNS